MNGGIKRIGWMGGSFDPIHNGHLILAQQAKEQLQLDEVWWIPAKQSPHKSDAPLVSFEDRCKLVELAIADLAGHSLVDAEKNSQDVSYTIDTVNLLRAQFPEVKFYLILGADQIQSLTRWNRIEELMSNVWFVRTRRPGYDDAETERIIGKWPVGWRNRLVDVDMPQLDISATGIRNRLAEGKTTIGWIPDGVRQRIEERGFYGGRTRTTD